MRLEGKKASPSGQRSNRHRTKESSISQRVSRSDSLANEFIRSNKVREI
jgi:hypothetical protein